MTEHDHPIIRRARVLFRNGHSVEPAAPPSLFTARLSPEDVADLKYIAAVSLGPSREAATRVLRRHGVE